jgi:membrane-associated protease RseP (regulator of RpoE activity)
MQILASSFSAFLAALLAALVLAFASIHPVRAQVIDTGSTAPKRSSDQVAEKITADPNAANAQSRSNRTLGIRVNDAIEIIAIVEDTVAEHVGLHVGDRIVAMDGRPMRSPDELATAIRGSPYQSGVLTIERANAGFSGAVAAKPDGVLMRVPINWTSGPIRRATDQRGSNDSMRFNGVGNGLRVGRVIAGSWAATSGLVQNDRIISLNRTPVTTRAQLVALLEDAAGSDGIPEMLVERGGMPTRLELHLPQGTMGPGSLTDVSHIIGTTGDLGAATGNTGIAPTGPQAVANGLAAPIEANRSPPGNANTSGAGGSPASK